MVSSPKKRGGPQKGGKTGHLGLQDGSFAERRIVETFCISGHPFNPARMLILNIQLSMPH
jgi:hypothetical protein